MTDSETKLKQKIAEGFILERKEDMTETYLNTLIQTLIITGDTELMSAFPMLSIYDQAPNINAKITALAIIQDELGHAHIAYRLLKDLGVDTDDLLYNRPPEKFKNPHAMDYKLDNWIQFGVFNSFYDRAGYTLLGDVFEHTSYGPWKRALVKVDKEEFFHLRNGEVMMKAAMENPETREKLLEAVNWMFLMALEFFGVSDELKSRSVQLEYKLKGRSNDELRQKWLSTAVPFCESIGLQVPAHYDEESGKYVLDVPFPCKYDEENKTWLYDQPDTWENMIKRFKRRGPQIYEFVKKLQKGVRELEELRQEAS
jgi:ring-1,2-phenylacetyl-CoA epoxidase subunit PaaA